MRVATDALRKLRFSANFSGHKRASGSRWLRARPARADCRCGQLCSGASGSHVLGRGVYVVCPTANSHCPCPACTPAGRRLRVQAAREQGDPPPVRRVSRVAGPGYHSGVTASPLRSSSLSLEAAQPARRTRASRAGTSLRVLYCRRALGA